MKDFMKNLHPSIKFAFEHSTQEISFLDMKIQDANSQQPCTENSLTVPHFYTSTPTTHLNSKKTLFYRRLLDVIPSLQMQDTTKRTQFPCNISPCQKIPFRNHHSQHLQSSTPTPCHSSLQNPKGIKFQNCPPSCNPILIGRKTILQVNRDHWHII